MPLGDNAMSAVTTKLADLKASSDEVSVVPELSPDALRAVLRSVNKKLEGETLLTADRVIAIRKGLESLAITTTGIYEVSAGRESVRRTSYESMNALALSANSSDVIVGGRKLANPFIMPERRKRFATALHAVLSELRAITQS
jgi:hypothetical protein